MKRPAGAGQIAPLKKAKKAEAEVTWAENQGDEWEGSGWDEGSGWNENGDWEGEENDDWADGSWAQEECEEDGEEEDEADFEQDLDGEEKDERNATQPKDSDPMKQLWPSSSEEASRVWEGRRSIVLRGV